MASPRTRGSTHPGPAQRILHEGFPAHAGIDRAGIALRHVRHGLPRARGDRPGPTAKRKDAALASPRTRGSTRASRCTRAARRGFPAHAGIDRGRLRRARGAHRLPRARGDRPMTGERLATQARASPRTRGSTAEFPRAPRTRAGFPAHAGIDLQRKLGSGEGARLPRARGDRPLYVTEDRPGDKASPRTRGSTLPRDRGPEVDPGFPAHAGIDRPRAPRRR